MLVIRAGIHKILVRIVLEQDFSASLLYTDSTQQNILPCLKNLTRLFIFIAIYWFNPAECPALPEKLYKTFLFIALYWFNPALYTGSTQQNILLCLKNLTRLFIFIALYWFNPAKHSALPEKLNKSFHLHCFILVQPSRMSCLA